MTFSPRLSVTLSIALIPILLPNHSEVVQLKDTKVTFSNISSSPSIDLSSFHIFGHAGREVVSECEGIPEYVCRLYNSEKIYRLRK